MLVRILTRRLAIVTAVVASAAATTPAAAQQWNAATDWSTATNPGNAWSYGYSNTLGGFTLLTTYAPTSTCVSGNPSFDCWYTPSTTDFTQANIYHNTTGATANIDGGHTVDANRLMEMTRDASFAVVQWTAPTAGIFDINGSFLCQAGDCAAGNGTYVFINGVQQFRSTSIQPGQGGFDFAALALAQGGTVDFIVDDSHGADQSSTANLAAEISQETPAGGTTTPEPGSLALLGTGLVGLVPMVRKKSRGAARAA